MPPRRRNHPVPQGDLADHPIERLAAIKGRLDYWDAELKEAVIEAKKRGFTWREISRGLGVTYQAVLQRFKAEVDRELEKERR